MALATRHVIQASGRYGQAEGLFGVLRFHWSVTFTGFLIYVGTIITYIAPVGAIGMGVALLGVLAEPRRPRTATFLFWLAAMAFWSVIGWPSSLLPDYTLERLLEFVKLLLITFTATIALRHPARLRLFCLFCLFLFVLFPIRGVFFNFFIYRYAYAGRAVWNGEFGNPNQLAAVMLLALSLAVSFLSVEQNRLWRLFACLVLALFPMVILMSQSRGVFIATVVFATYFFAGTQKKLRTLVVSAALVIGAVLVAPESTWERIGGLKSLTSTDRTNLRAADAEGSADERFRIWQTAFRVIPDSPVLGVGLGTYPLANGNYSPRLGNRDAHSTYLTLLAEIGIPGFLFFAAAIWSCLRHGVRARNRAAQFGAALSGPIQAVRALEAGLLGLLIAAIWGTFVSLSFLYLHLAVLWVTAEQLNARALDLRNTMANGTTR